MKTKNSKCLTESTPIAKEIPLLLMPCFTENNFGTKLITLFPENTESELPVLSGIMILNDCQTGMPLAQLNGSISTALRTGAVGDVSIRYLTPHSVQILGIVGARIQGLHQALFASAVRNLSDIYVFDYYPEKSSSLKIKLSELRPEIQIHPTDIFKELLQESHVVITATNSLVPVLVDKKNYYSKVNILLVSALTNPI